MASDELIIQFYTLIETQKNTNNQNTANWVSIIALISSIVFPILILIINKKMNDKEKQKLAYSSLYIEFLENEENFKEKNLLSSSGWENLQRLGLVHYLGKREKLVEFFNYYRKMDEFKSKTSVYVSPEETNKKIARKDELKTMFNNLKLFLESKINKK